MHCRINTINFLTCHTSSWWSHNTLSWKFQLVLFIHFCWSLCNIWTETPEDMLPHFSLGFVMLSRWLEVNCLLIQNGSSSSASFIEVTVSLLGISPPLLLPPLSFFLTLHISEWTEWVSFFIGPLNDLLKGAAMNGRRGWGWQTGKGGSGGWGYCAALYAAAAGHAVSSPPPACNRNPRSVH